MVADNKFIENEIGSDVTNDYKNRIHLNINQVRFVMLQILY